MPVFDWMDSARERANADPKYRALGSADATVYFQSGKHARRVSFEAFKIESIESVDLNELRDKDIVISMSSREWNSYLFNRRRRRAPALNALAINKPIIKTKSTGARLAFERISRSIQAFVDYGATKG